MIDPKKWIRTHIAASVVIGAALVASGGGAAVAAVASSAPETAIASDTRPTPQPTEAATTERGYVSPVDTEPVDGGTSDGDTAPQQPGTTPNGTAQGGQPAAQEPAADPAPAAPAPEPIPAPGAPTGITIQASGSAYLVTWNAPDMHGATLDHYWVRIVDPGYTRGEQQPPIYASNMLVAGGTAGVNCFVVAAVTTAGVQGDSAGPVCTDLW